MISFLLMRCTVADVFSISRGYVLLCCFSYENKQINSANSAPYILRHKIKLQCCVHVTHVEISRLEELQMVKTCLFIGYCVANGPIRTICFMWIDLFRTITVHLKKNKTVPYEIYYIYFYKKIDTFFIRTKSNKLKLKIIRFVKSTWFMVRTWKLYRKV